MHGEMNRFPLENVERVYSSMPVIATDIGSAERGAQKACWRQEEAKNIIEIASALFA